MADIIELPSAAPAPVKYVRAGRHKKVVPQRRLQKLRADRKQPVQPKPSELYAELMNVKEGWLESCRLEMELVRANKDVQAAIDTQTRKLLQEALPVIRLHLERRAAGCVGGWPRAVDAECCIDTVQSIGLDDALTFHRKLALSRLVGEVKSAERLMERFTEAAKDLHDAVSPLRVP